MNSSLVDQAAAALYDTLLEESAWEVALTCVASLFSASAVSVFEFDPRLNAPVRFRNLAHDEGSRQRYVDYRHSLDLGRNNGLATPVERWLADETMLTPAAGSSCEYLHDFARPAGVGWVAGWRMYANPDSVMYFGLQRPSEAECFGQEGVAAFEALKPHLIRFARLRERLDAAARSATLAQASLDNLSCGVLVVGADLRLRFANEYAQLVLRQGSALVERLSQVRGRSRYDDDHLCRIVRSACAKPGKCDGFLAHLFGEDVPPVAVMAVPLPATYAPAFVSPGPHCLLVFDGSASTRGRTGLLRSLFGLTYAEAELMTAIANGESLAEFSDRRHISLETARTQLRSVFAKTGANSQARLVKLALKLPPFGNSA
jgi:DNA-binding CsgD family transcriptional regulator